MADELKLIIDIEAKNAALLASIDSQVAKLGDNAHKSGLKISGAFLAASAAVAGIGVVIKKSLDAWGEQEQAILELNQAMKNSGIYTREASQTLQNYASELQKTTMFGDEIVASAMASLAAYGAQGEMLKSLTKATADLAAAKKMDLKSAADVVAKSIFGETNMLGRYGIQIEGAVGSTKRMESALQNISRLFGGQAETQASGYAGTMVRLKNVFGDIFEVIGSSLSPVLIKLANVFLKNSDAIIGSIQSLLQQISFIVFAFTNWGVIIGAFRQIWQETWDYIQLRFTEFITGFQSVGEVLVLFFTGRWKEAVEVAKQALTNYTAKGTDDMRQYKTNIQGVLREITAAWKEQTANVDGETTAQAQAVQNQKDKSLQHWTDYFLVRHNMAKLSVKQQETLDKELGNMASNLSSLMSSENEKLFKVGKAAAVANALVQTYQSAQAAFTSLASIPYVGPVLGAAAAAAAVTAGMLRVAQIKSQQMPRAEYGGIIPGSAYGTPLIAGEKNKAEAIIPLDQATRTAAGIGGGQQQVVLNINGPLFSDRSLPEQLVQLIDSGLEKLRSSGKSSFGKGIQFAT